MATNDERTLRNVLEKLELLTGERSDGSRRAVLISELNGLIQTLSDENAAVKKSVRELAVEFAASSALFKEEILVRADENSALAQIITTLKAQVGENIAKIEDTKRALATKTMAMAEHISSLSAQVGSAEASIVEERRVRVTEQSATAERFLTIEADFAEQSATITEFQMAYAADKEALAIDLSRIEAASGKKRVFRQDEPPENNTTNNLIVGDLWYDTNDGNKVYYWTGLEWVVAADARLNTIQKILRQSTPPSSAGRNVGDIWFDTDDNDRQYFWNGAAWDDLSDGIIAFVSKVYRQPNQPVGTVVGDIWFDTDDNNRIRYWDGSTWANASDSRHGNIPAIFKQTTAPSSTGRVTGDIWFDSDDKDRQYFWNGAAWDDVSDGRIDSITTVFRQTSQPVGKVAGDLWFDTDNGNKLYYFTGSTWVEVTVDLSGYTPKASFDNEVYSRATADNAIVQSMMAASAGTSRVYLQTTAPSATGRQDGDVWYNTTPTGTPPTPMYTQSVWYNGAWRLNTSGAYTQYVGQHAVITESLSSSIDPINNALSVQWGIRGTTTGNKYGGIVLTGVKLANDTGLSYKLELATNTYVRGVLEAYDANNVLRFSTYPNGTQSTFLSQPLIDTATINSATVSVNATAAAANYYCILATGNGSNSTGLGGVGTKYGVVGQGGTFDFYAAGTGANYGPFTGSHDALILPSDTIDVGDIVVDVECLVRRSISNTLFRVAKSTAPNQKAVVGVLAKTVGLLADGPAPAVFDQEPQRYPEPPPGHVPDYSVPPPPADNEMTPIWNAMKDNYVHVAINALGEGQINVCGENGDIEPGDLIVTSSIPGKGMKQADDIVRGYTVAKAREGATFSRPTEVKMVACIYLSG